MKKYNRILVIDPGANLGVAYFVDMALEYAATVTVEGTTDERLGKMLVWLMQEIIEFKPKLVIVEDVMMMVRFTKSTDAAIWLSFTSLLTRAAAASDDIPTKLIKPYDAKKYLCSKLNEDITPGQISKKHVVEYVKKNYNPAVKLKDHNACDAIVLGLTGIEDLCKSK